jgi:hypothetical protein
VHFDPRGHAEVRLDERLRASRGVLKEVEAGLNTRLCLGAPTGPELSIAVGLSGGYTAICVPEWLPRTGWRVITFLDPDMVTVEEVHQLKRAIMRGADTSGCD